MTIFLVVCSGIIGVGISRIAFGRWFNHVSLYTAIWTGAMLLFEVRLINYYSLDAETWIVITACWLLFLFGSVTVAVVRWSKKRGREVLAEKPVIGGSPPELQRLKKVLWVLNALTFAAALHDLYIVSQIFGSLAKAFILGNLLYSYRVSEGLPGSIPYVSSLVFTAALLAGNYTARLGKITLVAILPLIIIIMIDFANMGRVDILVVAILFATAYFLTPKQKTISRNGFGFRFRKLGMVLVILGIVVGGAELIRSTRGSREGFTGSTKTLQKLNTASVITPSVYLYLTSDYGVLNKYLRREGEETPMGGNTFLPLYRILERLGVEIHAGTYQSWYRTPVRTNTGTYLRELHGDFGIAGLLAGPYLIGLLSSVFWFRVKDRGRYRDLAVAGFFYGIVGMSFFVMPTRISPFLFYLPVSIVIGMFLDRKHRDAGGSLTKAAAR